MLSRPQSCFLGRTRRPSLHILRRFALAPGIVLVGEAHSVRNGRMAAVPEGEEPAGMRVYERDFTQYLKRVRASLLRVGIDPVRDFQAVDVGVVFHLPADGGGYR